MQKVEGSNPFSRSPESPAFAGLSAFLLVLVMAPALLVVGVLL